MKLSIMSFPYKILNDLSARLKVAEAKNLQDKNYYVAKIAEMPDASINRAFGTDSIDTTMKYEEGGCSVGLHE